MMDSTRDQRYETLRTQLESTYLNLANAEKSEQYQSIYDIAWAAAQTARDIESSELAFRSWTLTALAAYGMATHPDTSDRNAWTIRAYKSVLAASDYGASTFPADWLLSFATAICDIYEYMSTTYWWDDQKAEVDQWEQRLVTASETIIPIELVDQGSPDRTSEIARVLADLSYVYGRKKIACARSDFAIASARQSGALQALLDALYARYGHEKFEIQNAMTHLNQANSLDDLDAWLEDLTQPKAPGNNLVDRRAELRTLAEVYRRNFRSRTGRLWAAQYLTPMQHEFFKDELSDIEDEEMLFYAIDSMKARLLFDYLTTPFLDIPSPQVAAQAVEIEREILRFRPEAQRDAKLMILHEMRLMSELPIGSTVDDVFVPKVKERRMRLLSRVEEIYASQNAGFSSSSAPSTYQHIASSLEPDEVIIEYYLPFNRKDPTQQNLFIFVATHDRLYLRQTLLQRDPNEQWMAASMSVDDRQPIEQSLVGDKVVALRLAIQDGNETAANELLQMFYDVLIAPILELLLQLHIRRLIIVPHSTLHSIPFVALRSPDGQSLIENFALTIAPSASIWHRLQAAARPPVTSFVGFANPLLLSATWPPLPEAEIEVGYICDALKTLICKSFFAEEATETSVRQQTPGKSIIHFATHGDFPESDAIDLHRILLAPTEESDGFLHAEEIRHYPLQAARLVVLSICNGGIYRVGPGDEPYGLIPAVLTAGAENVTGTLWPIEDQAGRAFMAEFYKHILDSGPAEAYRRACIHFLRENKLLRDWAGWVLIGSGRPWPT